MSLAEYQAFLALEKSLQNTRIFSSAAGWLHARTAEKAGGRTSLPKKLLRNTENLSRLYLTNVKFLVYCVLGQFA